MSAEPVPIEPAPLGPAPSGPAAASAAGRAPDATAVQSRADLAVAGAVFGWITVVLFADRAGGTGTAFQLLLGAATWARAGSSAWPGSCGRARRARRPSTSARS